MATMLRRSRYTIVTEHVGSVASLYSTITGKHAILDVEEHPRYRVLLTDELLNAEEWDGVTIEALVREGFVVPADYDELSALKTLRARALEADYGVRLAILPSLECNFSCTYCFQGPAPQARVMAEETQDNLIEFADGLLRSGSKGPLVVTWFGGEPLLQLACIRSLSKRLLALAQRHRVQGFHEMLTNGYYLNLLSANLVHELGLSSITVSLDGPRVVHDERRPLKDGNGTFDTIISNIDSLSKYFSGILIRINVDRSNYWHVPDLLAELKARGILARCKFYTAAVDSKTGTCKADSCVTFNPLEVGRADVHIYREAVRLGVADQLDNRYPTPWGLACSAQIKGAFAVDPEGNLYKCLNDVAIQSRAVYNVNHKRPLNLRRAGSLQHSGPFGRQCCEACRFLPLCNAGCPSANIDGKTPGHLCTPLKYSLQERLGLYVMEYRRAVRPTPEEGRQREP